MDIQILRCLCTTRPKIVLEWAKRFRFTEKEHQHEQENYDEKALIAFQSINTASSRNPGKIIGWLMEKWYETFHQGGLRGSFGNNQSIEFCRNSLGVKYWVEALFNELMSTKPHLFTHFIEEIVDRDWKKHESRRTGWHILLIKYLESIHEKKPTHSFDILIKLWRTRTPFDYSGNGTIEFVVKCFLSHVYKTKPDRFFRFVEQKTKYLNEPKEFGKVVDKVLEL